MSLTASSSTTATITSHIVNHIKTVLSNVNKEYDKWDDLNFSGQPCPEFPDYGVDEQEVFIKHGWYKQLQQLGQFVKSINPFVEIPKDVQAKLEIDTDDFKDMYDESLAYYKEKYAEDIDENNILFMLDD